MIERDTIDGRNLIFIVGCPRSGTTWLQRLLACHPHVHTGQESKIFYVHIGPQIVYWRDCLNQEKHRGGTGLPAYFTEEEFFTILKAFLDALLQPLLKPLQAGELFLEKTPEHALFIPEIIQLLPKSRFIHILRDPRDVVASLLAASKSWGALWAPQQAKEAAWMWTHYVSKIRTARQQLLAGQLFEIRYEDLYANPVDTLRACIQFLCLEWDDDGLNQAVMRNSKDMALRTHGGTPIPLHGEVAKLSGTTVVEPQGFIRRASPGGWRKDLNVIQKYGTWRIARHLMAEMGYPWRFPV